MHFWSWIRPFLFSLSPETAHRAAFALLETVQSSASLRAGISKFFQYADPALQTRVFGLEFANPVGLAAGFDKDARLLPMWHALGFGFAEAGAITPLPQAGNPPPRLFRFPTDRALINRMGFNNEGSEAIQERLLKLLQTGNWPSFPIGINLGKGKLTSLEKASEDYAALLDAFLNLGDYFVVNISSPNTPGLRELQEKSRLDELFAVIQARNQARCRPHVRPLLVKVAPDLEWPALDDALELCAKHHIAGIIASNTTLSREGLTMSTTEAGGLSGAPLKTRSTELIRYIWKATVGTLPIIGVGGIFNAEDAYEKIRAGASLIQVYTGFVYQGPMMVRRMNEGLAQLLRKDGFRKLSDAVGTSAA